MTLAQLKRDAKSGKIKLELLERFGKTGDELPTRCQGIRSISNVNTVAITLVNENGEESELRFDSAKLVEYNHDSLIIYARGERALTEEENKILADWQKIQNDYIEKNPYSDCFWKKKEYFKNSPCPWLAGYETVRGKRYDTCRNSVFDNQIRGDAILKYIIYREDERND